MEMPVSPSPVPPTVYVPESGGKKLFSKRNILLMLFLLVMVGALPVGVYLTQKTQIFKSKATSNISETFTFAPEMAVKDPNDTTGLQYVSRKRGLITMQIKSDADVEPFLTGAGATPIPTAVPAPAGTPTPVPNTTATPAPAAVPGQIQLSASSCGGTQLVVDLSWNNLPGNTGYLIQRCKGSSCTGQTPFQITRPQNVTDYTDGPFIEGDTYRYAVVACTEGDLSNVVGKSCKSWSDSSNPVAATIRASCTPIPTPTPTPTPIPIPAPTATPVPVAPQQPYGLVLDGILRENTADDYYTVNFDWNAGSSTHHYHVKINNETPEDEITTRHISANRSPGSYLWWVQACTLQNQCSDWVKGPGFTCGT